MPYLNFSLSMSFFIHCFTRICVQVDDMTKELDDLLADIEQEGGLRDACTVIQRSSVLSLEEGINKLSEKLRMCKVISAFPTLTSRVKEILLLSFLSLRKVNVTLLHSWYNH